MVDAMVPCGNRRPQLQKLVSAGNHGIHGIHAHAESDDGAPDSFIGTSVKRTKRARTPLRDNEVDTLRTAREAGWAYSRCQSSSGSSGHGVGEDTLVAPVRDEDVES